MLTAMDSGYNIAKEQHKGNIITGNGFQIITSSVLVHLNCQSKFNPMTTSGLKSTHCSRLRGFKFTVHLNAFTTIQRTNGSNDRLKSTVTCQWHFPLMHNYLDSNIMN
jgi:hypothetical protein